MKNNKISLSICAALLLSSTLVMAEDYPAADFQPQVLFADDSANESAVKNQPTPKAATESVAKSASVSSSASTSSKATASVAATEAPKAEDSGSGMLFGLLALAAVGGFLVYKKQNDAAGSSGSGNQYQFVKDGSGLSGVARYLKNREMLSASGVERYLAKQQEAAAAAKAAASASESNAAPTGVEKYLKNRG